MNIGVYTKPLFDQITSQDKWYAGIKTRKGYMTAAHANMIKVRFANGTLRDGTLIKLMAHFGYEIQEVIWKKK